MQPYHHSKNPHDALERKLSILNKRFWSLVAVFVGLAVLNVGFLLAMQSGYFAQDSNQTQVNQLAIKPIIKKDYEVSVGTFFNNAAISEVDYQLELKRQSISTKGTTNCFTPEVPAIQNGCGFVVRPYASGITSKGTKLLKLRFSAQMNAEDAIVIDVRDTEKNEITSSLGTIQGKMSDRTITLPAQLDSNEQLMIRLWPKRDSTITINEVIIEHLSFAQLKPISLTLPKVYSESTLKIYQDLDGNKRLDDSTDIESKCSDNFPGVQPVALNLQKTVELIREDSCVTKDIPSLWSSDSKKNSLAPYNWLAVIVGNDGAKEIYPFEMTKDSLNIELQ